MIYSKAQLMEIRGLNVAFSILKFNFVIPGCIN